MATYNWSDLNAGDIFGQDTLPSFDPDADQLIFDDTVTGAADVLFNGNDVETFLSLDGKFVTLNAAPFTVTSTNLTFADGSVLIIGDNTTGFVNDDAANTITGGAGDDLLAGAGGADSISGLGGNDLFPIFGDDTGGYGNDTIDGGSGSDTIVYGDADFGVTVILGTGANAIGGDGNPGSTLTLVSIENVIGTEFDDEITGNSSANYLDGAGGDDTLRGGGALDTGNDTLIGGAGDDVLVQSLANDVIQGGDGFDVLTFSSAISGPVNVNLGAGTSTAAGSSATVSGIELVLGTAGNDTLVGGGLGLGTSGVFSEAFRGGAGDDLIDGRGAAVQGILGVNDRVEYRDDPAGVNVNLAAGTASDGFGGTDTLLHINWVQGSSFNDTLTGGNPENDVQERFEGLAGDDVIDGGSGFDEASYLSSPVAVNVNLALGTASDGFGGTDILSNIEVVRGSNFADTLTGGDSDDVFRGEAGDDTFDGGGGTDFAAWDTSSPANGGINAFLENGSATVSDGFGTTDTLINIEGLTGTSSNDTLSGGLGNQTFFGRGGNDVINGGADTDTANYNFDPNAVTVNLATNSATDGWGGAFGLQGTDTLLNIENVNGSTFADSITGDANANQLNGRGGDDYIDGGAGNDTLIGSEGRDTVLGGAGNDVLADEDGIDTLLYDDSPARVIVNMLGTGTVVSGADTVQPGTALDGFGGTDTISGFENVIGSNFNDYIQGSTNVANRLEGGSGNDTLQGSGRSDSIAGGAQDDTLLGGSGDDVLRQTRGNDFIDGGSGNDRLDIAGNGILSLNGIVYGTGAGESGVYVNLAAGTSDADGLNNDTVNGVGGDVATITDIEQVFGTAGNDTFIGGDALHAPTLENGEAELFRPSGGNDTITGADGHGWITIVDYSNATAAVTVTLGNSDNLGTASDGFGGTDTLINVDRVRGGSGADLLVGGSYATSANGNFQEHFRGNEGNDTLIGDGSDTTIGAIGDNDIAEYVNSPNAVFVNLGTSAVTGTPYGTVAGGTARDGFDSMGGGTDTLFGIDVVFGSAHNDTIVGGGPVINTNERMDGRAGNDRLVGVNGNDEADYSNDPAAVLVNLGLGTASDGFGGTDTLVNLFWARGGDFDDTIIGANGNLERLMGGRGDDLIDGGGTNGVSYAGYQTAVSGVNAFLANGAGTASDGQGGNDTLIRINGLWGGNFDDTLTGGEGDQWFRGRGGSDTIDGGAGIDTVNYSDPNPVGVTVNLATGTATDGWGGAWNLQGTDTLLNIENVEGSGFNDSITGSTGNNRLTGNGGNDTVDGGAGNDTLIGGAGDDRLIGGAGADSLNGGDGFDYLDGGTENDTMVGSEGRDTVLGGGGNDVFNGAMTLVNGLRTDAVQSFEGGAGNDTLNGVFGDGRTTIAEYRGATAGVIVNIGNPFNNQSTSIIVGADTIAAGTARDGVGGTDRLFDVDGVVGSMFNDVLVGGAFANAVGGSTMQFFEGLDGNDTITGGFDFGGAMVLYHDSPTAVNVNLGTGIALDGWGNTDTLFQIDHVRGSMHNDTLVGDSQDEQHFEGLGGNDQIDGGDGFDNVHYTRAGEAVYVNFAAGIGRSLADPVAGGSLGIDTLTSIEAAHGTDFADSMIGGGLGAQPHPGESFEAWEIALYQGLEEFEGRAGNDTLNGGDTAAKIDIALYRNAPSAVIVNLATGTATDGYGVNGNPAGTDKLIDINGVEGSRFNDTLIGGSGNEFFIGRDGNDSIAGGGGVDYISYDSSNRVNINLATGTATEFAGNGFGSPVYADTYTGIENVIGAMGNDTIIGAVGANVLIGEDGNDLLDGGGPTDTGNDSLYGGDGDDILRQTKGADRLDGGEGSDDRLMFNNGNGTVISTGITYGGATGVHVNLGAGTSDYNTVDVANPVGTIANMEVVYGTAGNDILTGGSDARAVNGSFREIFRGGEGSDTIDGAGTGLKGYGFIDRVEFFNITDAPTPTGVVVNLGTTVFAGVAGGTARDAWGDIDTLRNVNWIAGTFINDTMIGGDNAPDRDELERFQGNRGDDYIDGRGGIDEVAYIGATGAVNVNLGTGVATGADDTDTLLNIERVRGSRFGDMLIGSNNTEIVEVFIGESGNDTINGGAGIDFASWQPSNEDGVNAFISNGSGTVIHVEAGTDTLIGIEGLAGTNFDDSLAGGLGDQWFRGRGGSDTLNGGADIDTADYSTDRGGVIVNLGTTQLVVGSETVAGGTARDGWGGVWELGGTDKLVSIENVLGSTFNDRITGSTVANLLDGNYGNDTLVGGLGNDTLVGGSGDDSLAGGDGNDALDGGIGNDVLRGDAGNDVFTDKSGNDMLYGGTENDTFLVDYTTGTINANGEGGSDTWVLNPNATGSTYKVLLFDNSGTGVDRDYIDVGALLDASATAGFYTGQDPFKTGFLKFQAVGADKVLQWDITGGGNTYVNVLTLTGLGAQTVNSTSFKGYVQGGVGDNTLGGSPGDDVMLGLAGNDALNGGTGNDQLFGGDGADTMRGGTGDDTFEVDNAGDVVIEGADTAGALLLPGTATAGPGAAALGGLGDTVIAAINFSLEKLANVENIQLAVSASRAIGNASANRLTGNAGNDSLVGAGGNDTLDGGVGSDTMDGGAGNDVFFVDSANDVVKDLATGGGTDTIRSMVTEVLGPNVEHLVLLGLNAINGTGNILNNSITGNVGKNILTGDAGNDTLNGGGGNDTLAGGLGNDLYIIDTAGDTVTELVGAGTDTVQSSVTEILSNHVEHLVLTGNLAVNGTGNGLANSITGNANDNVLDGGLLNDTLIGGAGNDTLIGGAGTDSMAGGVGDDVYIVDAADVVIEGASAGTDTVQAGFTYSLAPAALVNVENLTLTGAAVINGTGNSLANVITGNTAANRLDGVGGDDTLFGGAGADTLIGGLGNDTLDGGVGADTLIGGAGDDTLVWDPLDALSGSIQGGTQTARDTLRVDGTGNIDLTTIDNSRITGVEIVDLTGSGNNTLTLGMGDVLAIGDSDELMVHGNAGDTVNRGGGWFQEMDMQMDGNTYYVYTQGSGPIARLLVDADMTSVV